MRNIFLGIWFIGIIYCQCYDYNQFQCSNDQTCEWIENVNYSSCSNFSQGQCNQYDSCSWTLSYGGGYGQWSYSCSGSYEVDNSFCQDSQPPLECSSHLNQDYCENPLFDCQWVPDLDFEDCNSYDESFCNSQESCNWISDIQYGNCSSLGEGSCDANPECYYDCEFWHGSCAGCCYGSCLGGTYVISDNSYCDGESNNGYCIEPYILGDLDLDGSINILDIVDLVQIVLNLEYDVIGDINQDDVNNIVDIILLVNLIIGD